MILVCIRAFASFKPGDEIAVPEGATFDTYYFERKSEGE